MKTNAKTNTKNTERNYTNLESIKVLRATAVNSESKTQAFMDVELNGIAIYGVSVVSGSNGDFLSFPQRKANNGKYYHVAYAYLSAEDQQKVIEACEDWFADNNK